MEKSAKMTFGDRPVMNEIFLDIQSSPVNNIVIDTTGSVLHLGEKYLIELKEKTLVVYIKESDAMHKEMFNEYLREPKPVCWEHLYSIKQGETKEEALARCYPELLEYRSGRYQKAADIVLPREEIAADLSPHKFLDLLQNKLS